jgi:hypothetical protein
LTERLAVARDLWQHHISADVQYEDSLSNSGIDYILQECRQQGIGWVVLVRHSRSQEGRGTSAAHDVVKVKSVLKKVETEGEHYYHCQPILSTIYIHEYNAT